MMKKNNDQRGSATTITEANVNSIANNDISQNALINEQQTPQIAVTLPVCAPTNSNCVQENSAVPQPNKN